MELLYCPFGAGNGVSNPFAASMTSLEKVLKNGDHEIQDAENGPSLVPKRKEVIVRGVLSVTVISADHLPAADIMGKSDPYVIVTMKKSQLKNKTRVSFGWPNIQVLSTEILPEHINVYAFRL